MSQSALVLALVAFLAGIIKGFTGFGGALVMAPVFLTLLSPGETLGTVVAVNVATAWQLLRPSWRAMQPRVVLPMAAACAAATPAGIALILVLDPASGRRIVGTAVLLSGIALLVGWRRVRSPNLAATLLVGALSGVMNGLAGVGGPPAALWLLAGRDGAVRDRSGLIVYVALTQTTVAAMAAYAGVIGGATVLRALALVPLHVLGTWVGAHLFHKAPDRTARFAAILVIVVLGAVTAIH